MANVIEFIVRARDEMSGALGKINAQAKEFQNTIANKVSAAGFDDLGAAIGRIPLGLAAAGAGAGAVVSLGKAALDTAQEVSALAIEFDILSQKTGASVEFLSTFRNAANDAEISSGTFNTAVTKFADNLFTISGAGANVEQELYRIADAFAAMEDGPQKTAIAINAFGKAGADMIPILNEGSAGIKRLQQDMSDAGRVIDSNTVAAANRLDAAMDKLNGQVDGLKVRIGSGLIPALSGMLDNLTNASAGSQTLEGRMAEAARAEALLSQGAIEAGRSLAIAAAQAKAAGQSAFLSGQAAQGAASAWAGAAARIYSATGAFLGRSGVMDVSRAAG